MSIKNDGYVTHGTGSDNPLRRAFIDNPERVRRLILTENQSDLVRSIRADGNMCVTSRRMADEQGKSVQSISAQLTKLWYRGYLERRESIDDTGGIIYLYRAAI